MNTTLDSSATDDAGLVERHLAGDPAAFRLIVERHYRLVCAVAYSACGDVSKSEDLAQEAFLAAWKQLPQLREPTKLRAWLCGIARTLGHNQLRREGRSPRADDAELEKAAAEETDPGESAIRSDQAALMWSALAELPEAYREPMVLFYRENQSAAHVAEALELSEETVRQRLSRGRAMLSERMAALVEETLERSAPKPALVLSILVMLPGPLAPTLLEATGLGAGTKTLATAGGVAGFAAKGGLALKFISALAFLPALLQGATDFIRFNEQNPNSPADPVRRKAAWAYLTHHVGIGLFMVAAGVLPQLMSRRAWPWFAAPIVLVAFVAIRLSVRTKIQLNKLTKGQDCTAATSRGFEQRSTARLLGLPLYHIRLGTRTSFRSPAVKAWIAISDRRAIGGLFAFGPFALAPVAMGIVSAGILDFGIVALGVGVMGVLAAGWWSVGLAAVGGYAARGLWVFAPEFTSRASTFAKHAGDAVANVYFDHHLFFQFTKISAQCFLWAAFVGWVMPVALTGWQLWRTRESARTS
ncbi:MAG TPA: sigma-70 family RNA polymerase sigma factor [Candidatus Didemnitutus sp.]|nr:sigma-70 family RNA polymerase sigma factor [Candidatus Didemnitutus sp.]